MMGVSMPVSAVPPFHAIPGEETVGPVPVGRRWVDGVDAFVPLGPVSAQHVYA